MKNRFLSAALGCSLALFLRPAFDGSASAGGAKPDNSLLSTMQEELQRAQGELGKLDPAPYFMSYAVQDQNIAVAVGSQGSLVASIHQSNRFANVIVRVGAAALDNTHAENRASAISSGVIPLADNADAISRALWQLTYGEYRKASEAYLKVKTTTQVKAKEEDTSPDFSPEMPHVHNDYSEPAAVPDQEVLEKMVRRYSGWFSKYPYIYRSVVMVTVQRARRYFVCTEGTRVVVPDATIRLMIEAQTQADDGMELMRVESYQVETVDQLPDDAEIAARVEKMVADLKTLRVAPLAEPYDGPALLSGRAAAVFFHEVLGHRLEGHRQRGEQEAQTLAGKVGERVLPEFLSVADDPTERTLNGMNLGGWYEYDDEGVPASHVELVENGVLKNFLMSRMPIKGFGKSNGHGRAQPGLMVTGRQGNMILTSSHTVKDAELRQKLIDEVKRQGKPYGLYFEDIQGGFTLTQRWLPQSFLVLPILVWRVYPDGRPDELVRGVDIVGTPLAAMGRILLTGEKKEVFNGICAAESGSVPVSAVAPGILFSDLEVQKRPHALNRPPILPPPGFEMGESSAPAKSEGWQ